MEAFGQVRTWKRAFRLGISQLLCLGRHTVTNLLCTAGRQGVDWSADYRLYSQDDWQVEGLFAVVLRQVAMRLPPGRPLVLAMDDTHLKKTGRHIPGAGYRRDPLSPAFACNLIWAQRFLQVSAALYDTLGPAAARCIPLAYEHAPSIPHPRKADPPEKWKEYRRQRKLKNLSTQGLERLRRLRQQMDAMPEAAGRRLLVTVDGSYTNKTVLRGLPPETTLIGRVRKDISLFAPAWSKSRRGELRRRYGSPLATPEQLRRDEAVAWHGVRAYAAGAVREFRVKTLSPVLWKKAGPQQVLQLMVVAPLGYRLRQNSRLLYRQPAFLLCTDPQLPEDELLQYYLWRWGVEVNHRDEKQIVGVGQAQVTNERSAWRQPALAVFSYALLLLAAADTWGVAALDATVPLPKWRSRHPGTMSTQQMVQQLRKEAWAYALNDLAQSNDDFVIGAAEATKPSKLCDSLASAVLLGSAA
jgi:DDE superfamily endonuclease